MINNVNTMQLEDDIEAKRKKLEEIKKFHFAAKGYQCVDSDIMIFLISELYQFYFPSD